MTGPITIAYTASPTLRDVAASPAFVRGVRGPVGSGKSVGCIMDCFTKALQQRPNSQGFRKTRWALVRQTYPELKSTTLKTFQDWIPPDICPVSETSSPIKGTLNLPLPDGTMVMAEFLFIALDTPKDLGKLLSLELTGAFLNESKELIKEVLDVVTSRVGRYPSARDGGPTWHGVIMDTNAPSDYHWWAELEREPPQGFAFFDQPPALIRNDKTREATDPLGYKPNPLAENVENLPGRHQYYLNLLAGKDENWIRAYILNEFAASQAGKPVYQQQFNDRVHVAPHTMVAQPDAPVIVGLDFGLTPAAIFTQCVQGQLRVLDELCAHGMGIEQFLTNDLLPFIGQTYYNHNLSFIGDPSGVRGAESDQKSCFDVLMKFGLPALPAHTNALEPRLGAVRHFLSRMAHGAKPAFVVNRHCRVLVEGFQGGYHYPRIQASGEAKYREKPEKNSRFSHPHDALQYAALRHQVLLNRAQHAAPITHNATPVVDSVVGY